MRTITAAVTEERRHASFLKQHIEKIELAQDGVANTIGRDAKIAAVLGLGITILLTIVTVAIISLLDDTDTLSLGGRGTSMVAKDGTTVGTGFSQISEGMVDHLCSPDGTSRIGSQDMMTFILPSSAMVANPSAGSSFRENFVTVIPAGSSFAYGEVGSTGMMEPQEITVKGSLGETIEINCTSKEIELSGLVGQTSGATHTIIHTSRRRLTHTGHDSMCEDALCGSAVSCAVS